MSSGYKVKVLYFTSEPVIFEKLSEILCYLYKFCVHQAYDDTLWQML